VSVHLARPSIRLRLTAWYAGIFLALGTGLLALSYAVVRHEFRDESAKVHVAVEELVPRRAGGLPRTLRVRIAPGIPRETAAPVRRLTAAERDAYRRARNAYAVGTRAANDRALRHVLLAFGLALALVTVASVAAGWIVAGRALRPIKRITATARSISDETLDARIALAGPRDELRELADTFDTMLGRLEGAFESQRRFVANASHELRTPLSIVRAELDVTLDDPHATENELRAMARVVRDANERMERLIGSLLDLAGGEAGVALPRPADLAAAVRPALAAQPALADGGTITLDAVLEPAPVEGDPVLLERLAANLVENAVRYNAALGWVRVRTGVQRGEAVLTVENAGPPVPADEAPALLEPFQRLDASRARATGGYGLGLAVVRAVAQAHGGRVVLLPRAGGGLEVTVALPAAHRRPSGAARAAARA
jgi:signal transduction histidine kinase